MIKKITVKEIGSALVVSTSTAKRRISKLKEEGILSREGATKKGNCILNRK